MNRNVNPEPQDKSLTQQAKEEITIKKKKTQKEEQK